MRARRRIGLGVAFMAVAGCGARSELRVLRDDGLICPTGAYATRVGAPVTLRVSAPGTAAGRLRWQVVGQPAGATPALVPDGALGASFVSAQEGGYAVRVELPGAAGQFGDAGADARETPTLCSLWVNVRARGPQAQCPAEVSTRPRVEVALNATVDGDRAVVSRVWSLAEAPAGSARPGPAPTDGLATRFTPDVAGDYRVRFRATDASGEEGACETVVHAVPTEALRVELFWNPPDQSCDGAGMGRGDCDDSDVDLHLLRGSVGTWASPASDCYYANCTGGQGPAWDSPGVADDPRLDIDDREGFGPENINLDRTGSASYRIGVHFFEGQRRTTADATVVVYCGGATAAATLGPTRIVSHGGVEVNDFWLVADVVMAPGGCQVRPITQGAGPWIITHAEARNGAGPPPPGP